MLSFQEDELGLVMRMDMCDIALYAVLAVVVFRYVSLGMARKWKLAIFSNTMWTTSLLAPNTLSQVQVIRKL
jgi:hypothetical protein